MKDSTPFENFWAQFQNFTDCNGSTKTEELGYLRGLLEKDAGHRFDGSNKAYKYGIEVRNIRRKPAEP